MNVSESTKRQCNMKIEDERVCVTVSTVRRQQQTRSQQRMAAA